MVVFWWLQVTLEEGETEGDTEGSEEGAAGM